MKFEYTHDILMRLIDEAGSIYSLSKQTGVTAPCLKQLAENPERKPYKKTERRLRDAALGRYKLRKLERGRPQK